MLVFGAILAAPRALFLKETATYVPQVRPGYLISHKLTPFSFLEYWFMNFGLFFVFIPIGFLLSPKNGKKLFVAFLSLFLIGNLIQFSPEMASNHKFFNVFLIIGNMFTSFVIYKLWKKHLLTKLLVIPIVFFLVFSGIIEFFAVANDGLGDHPDYPKNNDIAWIIENTEKEAVFLNSTYLYDSASLAGRKIFFGWPYFAWSVGHDTYKRDEIIRKMLNPTNLNSLCSLLKENNIDYISIEGAGHNEDFEINFDFFEQNFNKNYTSENGKIEIYKVSPTCLATL